ncbi:MAG: hypothetical protein ACRDIB_04555, partial [Ardenticatenaceae bacterium]
WAADQGALHEAELAEWFRGLETAAGERQQITREQLPAGTAGDQSTERVADGENNLNPPDQRSMNEEQPDGPWHRRVVAGAARLQEVAAPPERYGTVGAIAIATWAIGSAWQLPGRWQLWFHALLLLLALWAGSLLLAWPPSHEELRIRGTYPWRWLKLFRLSGTACGVFVAVGLLWWLEALVRVLFQATMAGWLVYMLLLPGVIFAYAGGLDVQYWFYRRREENAAFYIRTAVQVTAMILVAQALFVAANHLMVPYLSGAFWHILLLTPAIMMLFFALRGGSRKPGGRG